MSITMVTKLFYYVSLFCLRMNRYPYEDRKWGFSVSGMLACSSTFFVFGKDVGLKEPGQLPQISVETLCLLLAQ